MATLAFLINPIAGMGGRVGLKGTDGAKILAQATKLGAESVAQERAAEAVRAIYDGGLELKWLTCQKSMGEDVLTMVGYDSEKDYEVVYSTPEFTTAQDTLNACAEFKRRKVELIVFCGGDGTARDIYDVIGKDIPILGIPAGVKMFSAVFGVNPSSTAAAVMGFLRGEFDVAEAEIMDIDEERYRVGELHAKLYGYAVIPYERALIQTSKIVYESMDDEAAKHDIAHYVKEIMDNEKDTLFILGAGSTMERIGKVLNIEKTLLGVDVVKDGKLIAKDVNEAQLLGLLEKEEKTRIIMGVIGAQGFVFGRGNQQLSPQVLRTVGIDNIRIVATPYKLSRTPTLRVDTGDGELDNLLSGYHKVIMGYHEMRMMKIEGG